MASCVLLGMLMAGESLIGAPVLLPHAAVLVETTNAGGAYVSYGPAPAADDPALTYFDEFPITVSGVMEIFTEP